MHTSHDQAYIRFLRRLRISSRFFLLFLVLSLIPILILSMIATLGTSHQIEKKVWSYCEQMNSGYRAAFDEVLNQMSERSISVIYDQDIQRRIGHLLAQKPGTAAYLAAEGELRREIRFRIALDASVTRASIYFDFLSPCTYSGSIGENKGFHILQEQERQLVQAANQEQGGLVWNALGSVYQSSTEMGDYTERSSPILQNARRFANLANGKKIGTITLWFNSLELDNLCKKLQIEGALYLLDRSGNVIFSNVPKSVDQPFPYGTLPELPEESIVHWKLRERDVIMTASKSHVNDCYYVHVQPYSVLMQESYWFGSLMLLLAILALGTAAMAAGAFARSIKNPLNRIWSTLNQVASEVTFDRQIEDTGTDEIAALSGEIDDIILRLGTLVEENYAIKLRENKFKLMALKAQINPHFIFNTIDSIRWTARQHEDFEVSKRLEMLSNLLRDVLRDESTMVTLGRELKSTQNYLLLQKSGLREKLQLSYDVDEQLLNQPCPHLILQPLVENSICHGMTEERPLEIRITAERAGENLRLIVEDNGAGMSREQIQESMRKELGEISIGLSNVHNRLQAIYPTAQFLVESEPGFGTIITMEFPMKESEAE